MWEKVDRTIVKASSVSSVEMEVQSDINRDNADISDDNSREKSSERSSKAPFPRKQSRGANGIMVKPTIPKKREDVMKWYGWGYKDVMLQLWDEADTVTLSGNRYPNCEKGFPFFLDYMNEKIGSHVTPGLEHRKYTMPEEHEYPSTKLTKEHIEAIKELGIDISIVGTDRFFRSHDQTIESVIQAKNKIIKRIPDGVVWPTCHEDVVEIVKLAHQNNIVIIPFGGGTAVSGAADCPEEEERPIIIVDTSQMNEILWVNKESLIVCVESGIVGQDLERELNKIGFTVGHEPDSKEFSTVGGWISTRASGMKKNTYGNIEDIVLHVKLVTPSGVLQKWSHAPRMSVGPDFNHFVMGSEGCFGVITDVCLKLRHLPPVIIYDSLVFPDFIAGVKFLREVSKKRLHPTSLRLMDNQHLQFGMAFRTKSSNFKKIIDGLKKLFIENVKGYSYDKMSLATLLYEGEKEAVEAHQRTINSIAKRYGGVSAGSDNGRNGYNTTFIVGYIRDIAIEFNVLVESVEVSISWDGLFDLMRKIRTRLQVDSFAIGIYKCLVMFRVAQAYETGCCLYIYFSLPIPTDYSICKLIGKMHHAVREEAIEMKASLSHHHGVGKTRRRWYETSVSTPGRKLLQSAKLGLDPKNIFAVGNLVYDWNMSDAKCKL